MWSIETVGKTIRACDGKGGVVDIDPDGEAFIDGKGETVLLVKNSEGSTRSIIHIGADGAATVARTKSAE